MLFQNIWATPGNSNVKILFILILLLPGVSL
jgi:hypothetical protein